MIATENTIITILGRKGMGKSTLTAELIDHEPRVIILDTMGGYGRGSEIVWGRDEAIEAMLKASRERRFRIAVRVVSQDDMLDVLDMAWELTDYWLVCEETSIVCGSPPFLHSQLAMLNRFGRHRRISQIYIARRPTELPRDLTAQSDLIVTFHQKEPRDLAYLQACGFDPEHVVALKNDLPGRGTVAVVGDIPLPLPVLKRLEEPSRRASVQGELTLDDDGDTDDAVAEQDTTSDVSVQEATENATSGAT